MKHPFEEILPAQKPSAEGQQASPSERPLSRRDIVGLVVAFPAFAIVACGRLPLADNSKENSNPQANPCGSPAQAGCDPNNPWLGDGNFATSLVAGEEGGSGLVLSQAAQEAGSASKLPTSTQTLGEEGADNFVFTFDLLESGSGATSTATSTSTSTSTSPSVTTTAMNESGVDPTPVTTAASEAEGGGPLTTAPDPGESGGGTTDSTNEDGVTSQALGEEGGDVMTTAPEPGESGGALWLRESRANFYLQQTTEADIPSETGGPLTTAPDPGESGGSTTNGLNEEGGSPATTAAGPGESGGDPTTTVGDINPLTVDGVRVPDEQQKQTIRANAAVARENLGVDYTSLDQAEEGGGFAGIVTSNALGEEGGAGNEVTSVTANEEGGDSYLAAEGSQGWLAISRAFSNINEQIPPSAAMRFKLFAVRYKGKRQNLGKNERVYLVLYSLKTAGGEFKLRHVYVWSESVSAVEFAQNIEASLSRRFAVE